MKHTMTAEDLIHHLALVPLPQEGGFFRETYRSADATAIYYLLTQKTVSIMHRLTVDEVFHFYGGAPVEQLLLAPNGQSKRTILGPDLAEGHTPQQLVPSGIWQGARLLDGGGDVGYALMGTTVAPPFDFSLFELGTRAALIADYPDHADLISALTLK